MARLLVVDDDADIAWGVVEALKHAGYEAGSVGTGTAALAACAERCPDLVLLDQMLPDIDGLEVCRRLRTAPETKTVPIVFLTARTDEKARILGLAAGADDYVVKPFSTQELLLRVRAVLRRSTPVEMVLPPVWVKMRDQYRLWNSYAEIHLARGEWADCLEVLQSIQHHCEEALAPAERAQLLERMELCSRNLRGDPTPRSSREPARRIG